MAMQEFLKEAASRLDRIVVPLEEGDPFEPETPPGKRQEPLKCNRCLLSPGRHNNRNLELEIRWTNLASALYDDIISGNLPEGVTLCHLSNHMSSRLDSGLRKCSRFSGLFPIENPFWKFLVSIWLISLCVMMISFLMLGDGFILIIRCIRSFFLRSSTPAILFIMFLREAAYRFLSVYVKMLRCFAQFCLIVPKWWLRTFGM
ncbi:uncharacterized protein LOC100906741 [Galendromus occidentalis]|uniref:Uncharacterized protein LOC100906741 n=1 Tax=Galendromus occidentalis TaxID=34638 RepID=A0AAJ6QSX7_9ACAR|nr:uncharacterized protein LOC100906741 [Galendromus occidentalis]